MECPVKTLPVAVFCHVIVILSMCNSQSPEHFLKWTIHSNASVIDLVFDQENFITFYRCLCAHSTKLCLATVVPPSNALFLIGSLATQSNSNVTRYVCAYRSSCDMLGCTIHDIECQKVKLTDVYDCSNTQSCVSFQIKNDIFSGTVCDLPYVEIIPAPNQTIALSLEGSEDGIFIAPCTPRCKIETEAPPTTPESTLTPASLTSTSTTSSAAPGSTSDTDDWIPRDHAIVIGVVPCFVVVIIAMLIIFLIWRRWKQKLLHIIKDNQNGLHRGDISGTGSNRHVTYENQLATLNSIDINSNTSCVSRSYENQLGVFTNTADHGHTDHRNGISNDNNNINNNNSNTTSVSRSYENQLDVFTNTADHGHTDHSVGIRNGNNNSNNNNKNNSNTTCPNRSYENKLGDFTNTADHGQTDHSDGISNDTTTTTNNNNNNDNGYTDGVSQQDSHCSLNPLHHQQDQPLTPTAC